MQNPASHAGSHASAMPEYLRHHRLRHTAHKLAVSLPGTHWFIVAFVGLYFVCFEVLHGQHTTLDFSWVPFVHWGTLAVTFPDVKWGWDHLFSTVIPLLSQDHWDHVRHLLRNDGEIVCASIAFFFIVYNPYKTEVKRITSAWEILGRVVLTLALIVVVLVLGDVGITHLQHALKVGWLNPTFSAHPSIVQKLYSDTWMNKVLVLGASFVLRRIMYPVYDFNMRWFAGRRVAAGKHARWYHLPAYHELVESAWKVKGDSRARAVAQLQSSGAGLARLIIGFVTVWSFLGALGVWVLQHYK